jgi:hypothetical protein
MHDPDVVLTVDSDAGHLAEHPVAGQRLRPEWLRLEAWNGFRFCLLRLRGGTVTLTGFTTNCCTCAASRVQSNQQLSLFSGTQKQALFA